MRTKSNFWHLPAFPIFCRAACLIALFLTPRPLLAAPVIVGIDVLLEGPNKQLLKNKRVGIITNHTAINRDMVPTAELLKQRAGDLGYEVVALFAPEHGITGVGHASDKIEDDVGTDGIPIYSLHGKTRRPTDEMLKNVDLLLYDIQDIGSRSYTYISTLFYAMEEAAKRKIPVIVADRPNPINGITIDGPMLEDKWRSFVGYVNVPYCHGMTVGELAQFFNQEYKVGCELHIVPMQGWKRSMSFQDTGLPWIPTSPNIPEGTTPWYYPSTGFLGELQLVNIGIGYTLPFKVVGAPWIIGAQLANQLNQQNLPGVAFFPFYFKPYFGRFSAQDCEGILLAVTNTKTYRPVETQYAVIGLLKSLYPSQFAEALEASKDRKEMFCKVNGTDRVYNIMMKERYPGWKLRQLDQDKRLAFRTLREKYLLPVYSVQ